MRCAATLRSGKLIAAPFAATLLIAFSVVLLLTLEWLRGRSEKLRTQVA